MAKFIKIPKMSPVCSRDELRPTMNYIYFNDGKFVATDGHILIVRTIEDYFDFEFPGPKYLHWKSFKFLEERSNLHLLPDWDRNGIRILREGYQFMIFFKNPDEFDIQFPDYRTVMPDLKDIVKIGSIAGNGSVITRALKTFDNNMDLNSFRFNFFGPSKAVLVESLYNNDKMIFMPIMDNPYFRHLS